MSVIGNKLQISFDSVKNKLPFTPEVGLVLGSGLGSILDNLTIEESIPYSEIADFPHSTAPGHKGQFLFVHIGKVPCVLMQGRVHYYEGYDMADVVKPVRMMALMGVKKVILTNAAGGLQKGMQCGDIMMITDHISQFVPSPLRGENYEERGPRFPDMTNVYSLALQKKASSVAKKVELDLKKGVYVQFSGPQFETPTEIKMCSLLGASACGMSTGVEAIALRHMGVEVMGFSMITNLAAGLSDAPLDENDVIEIASRRGKVFASFIENLIKEIGE